MSSQAEAGARSARRVRPRHVVLVGAIALVALIAILLRFSVVTDYIYHATVKDPVRVSPEGRLIVAPADGTVLYVKRVEAGIVPEVIIWEM